LGLRKKKSALGVRVEVDAIRRQQVWIMLCQRLNGENVTLLNSSIVIIACIVISATLITCSMIIKIKYRKKKQKQNCKNI
jgi:hypothetical protein